MATYHINCTMSFFFLSKRGVFFPPAPSPCHRAKIRSPARGIFTLPWILKRLPIHQVLVLPTSEVYSIHPYLPSPRPLALAGWSVPHDHPSLLYLFLLLQESERTVWMASPELKCKVIIHSFSCYRAVLMIRDDGCTSTDRWTVRYSNLLVTHVRLLLQ